MEESRKKLMEMKAIQGREKRWARARTSAEPVRLSATSVESACPFFDARKRGGMGQKDGGMAKKVDREEMGKAGTSGTVSHCFTLVSCPFFDARNDQRKRAREGEG